MAIKEFSAVSWRGPAERTIAVISLKSRVDSILEKASSDPAQREGVVIDYTSLISSFTRWGAEQASQGVITSALVRVEAPRYPKVDLAFVKLDRFRRDTPQGQTVAMEKIRDTLELLSQKDIEFNLIVQDYVSKAATAMLAF